MSTLFWWTQIFHNFRNFFFPRTMPPVCDPEEDRYIEAVYEEVPEKAGFEDLGEPASRLRRKQRNSKRRARGAFEEMRTLSKVVQTMKHSSGCRLPRHHPPIDVSWCGRLIELVHLSHKEGDRNPFFYGLSATPEFPRIVDFVLMKDDVWAKGEEPTEKSPKWMQDMRYIIEHYRSLTLRECKTKLPWAVKHLIGMQGVAVLKSGKTIGLAQEYVSMDGKNWKSLATKLLPRGKKRNPGNIVYPYRNPCPIVTIESLADEREAQMLTVLFEKIAIQQALQWKLYFKRPSGPEFVIGMDRVDTRELLAYRDKQENQKRRPAAKHWVTDHVRRNGQIVPAHMRGETEFTWNGFDFRVETADEDIRSHANGQLPETDNWSYAQRLHTKYGDAVS